MYMAELQQARGGQPQGVLHPSSAGNSLLMAAERAWGGPLPGVCKGIQTDPLRCEMMGQPPERILKRAGVPAGHPLLCRYWQIYLDERICCVYHNRLSVVPLPALPAGITICTETTSVQIRYAYDDGAPLPRIRLYVSEVRYGTVRAAWPDLVPEGPCGPWSYYGIDYDRRTLDVEAVSLYRVSPQFAPPSIRETVLGLGRVGR